MNPHVSTQADATAAILQAARGEVPVMIPGAWEIREARPAAGTIPTDGVFTTPRAAATAGTDRERLEREREGGGAPSQRRPVGQNTRLARLWHVISHPTDLSTMWHHPLPEQR
jgi:hypothetical protein